MFVSEPLCHRQSPRGTDLTVRCPLGPDFTACFISACSAGLIPNSNSMPEVALGYGRDLVLFPPLVGPSKTAQIIRNEREINLLSLWEINISTRSAACLSSFPQKGGEDSDGGSAWDDTNSLRPGPGPGNWWKEAGAAGLNRESGLSKYPLGVLFLASKKLFEVLWAFLHALCKNFWEIET